MKKIDINGQELKYVVKVKNNKNTYFKVKDDYVLVTTNKYVSEKIIVEHLIQNNKRYFELINRNDEVKKYFDDSSIYLWGIKYPLYISNSNHFKYEINELGVFVSSKELIVSKIKRKIYLNEIKVKVSSFESKINNVLLTFNINEQTYHYKYLKSKFGSFHKKKDKTYITLNTFLATLDEQVLYYVIMHEYAHVKEFNHSKKFYSLLAQMMPNYRKYDNLLKKIVIM